VLAAAVTCTRKTLPAIIEDLSFGVEEGTAKEDLKNEGEADSAKSKSSVFSSSTRLAERCQI
jgi:hypothetical protein